MLIRFLVVPVVKYKITVKTVFCSHACDSEAGSVPSCYVSYLPRLCLLGKGVSRRSEDHVAGGLSPRVSGLDRAPEITLCHPRCLNTKADNWE